MKHSTRPSGVVLDRFQSLLLSFAAADEGIDKSLARLWKDPADNPLASMPAGIVREAKAELLSSILILGPVHLLLPRRLQQMVDLSEIESNGIVVTSHLPYDAARLNRLQLLYDRIFAIARLLEADPHTASPVRFSQIFRNRSSIDVETQLEDYSYYLRLLLTEMFSVRDLAPELFELLAQNLAAEQYVFGRVYAERYKGGVLNTSRRRVSTANSGVIEAILETMGLKPRTAEQMEAGVTVGIPGYFDDYEQFDAQ